MNAISSKATQMLKSINLLVLDVDGVLTDGRIIYSDNETETKMFHVKDGLGIRMLIESGVQVGIITGRRSKSLHRRCQDLDIVHIFDGIQDKAVALDTMLERTGVCLQETACIGDDLPDLALMKKVGLSICVADAHEALLKRADMVTSAKGGDGAVREVCEEILKAKGLWETVLDRY